MRYELLIITLLLFLPGLAAGAVTPHFYAGEVYFDFNKPNGSVVAFSVDESLVLNNPSAAQVEVSGLNVIVEGISGVSVTPEVTGITVPANSTGTVTLTFSADSAMAEGKYSGTLKVSGTNVENRSIGLIVAIHHPLPTINATWNPAALGDVKAGSKLSYILTVSEVMGYGSAEDVKVSIYGLGPVENVTYSGTLGNFSPLTSQDIEVNFSVPDRKLLPGSYSIIPRITSKSTITANADELGYRILDPKMSIRPQEIDFGKITFETGKDSETVVLNVSEIGGYTPIEKLSISLISGEEGWITYPNIDYIPAGESENYSFGIFLPQDASLGFKSWDFEFDTSYAGTEYIHAVVIVSFPGTDEAIAFLENTSTVTNSTSEENLIKDTISLLEASKDKTQLRKIAMVMSIYSGVRTFLSNLGTVADSEGKLVEAGDGIIRAESALNKMQIGDQNLQDAELKLYSSKIVSSAEEIWNSEAGSMLKTLEENAENEKDSNYKLTALYYNRISKIYTLLDDSQSAEKYSEKQGNIEGLYHETLLEAGDLTRVADSELDSARERMFSPGEGTYLVLNPFSYDFVSRNYDNAIDKYGQAGALYRKAGEDSDADLLKNELEEITRQRNNIYRNFIVYGSFLWLVFLWFVGRVVWGLQNYNRDEMEGQWGDVITGEVKAVGGIQTWVSVTEEASKDEKVEKNDSEPAE